MPMWRIFIMRVKFLIRCILASIFLASCAHEPIPFTTSNENTWFFEKGSDGVYPIYCMANKKDKTAEPICLKAERRYLKQNEYGKITQPNPIVPVPTSTNISSSAQAPAMEAKVENQSEESSGDPQSWGQSDSIIGPMNGCQKETRENILSK